MAHGGSGWRRRADLLSLLALAVILAVVAVAGFAATQIRERAWRDARAEAERVATALRFSAAELFSTAEQALDRLSRHLDAPELQDLDAAARRAALLAVVPRGPAFGGSLVLDSAGAILFDSRGETARTEWRSDREYFTFHRDHPGHALHVGVPLRGHVSGRPLIPVSRRLDHPDGRFRGVVATAIEIGHLQALFEQVRIGTGGTVALMRDDGVFLLRVPFIEGLLGRSAADMPAFQAMRAAHGAPFVARTKVDGEERLFLPMRLPGLPVTVLVNRATDDIRAEWRPGAIRVGLVFGTLIALLLLMVGVFRREIARRAAAEAKAGESAALLRLIADHSPELVVIVGPDGRRRFVSAGSQRLFGIAPAELLGGEVEAAPMPEDRPRLAAARQRLASGASEAETVEYRVAQPDGRIVWVAASLRAVPGTRGPQGVSVVAFTRDISAQKAAEAALAWKATTDALTGALNRGAFAAALAEATARGEPVATIAIDLDHFKEVNDAAGHVAGDAVLRAAADRLRLAVRKGDAVARLGGDEFAILVRDIEGDARIGDLAERIRQALHEPVPWQGKALPAGATLGVARAPRDGATAEAAMQAADEALVRAKRARRGSIGVANAADAQEAARSAAILRAVPPDAAEFPGIGVALQPMVRFDGPGMPGNSILAVEAFARWTLPELGPVPPDEAFRVLGPDRGVQFGCAVRTRAFAAFAGLRGPGRLPCRLAINLSATEVLRPEVILLIEEQAAEAGLGLDALMLEITEEVLTERVSDRALDLLAGLQRRGAVLALDDFGTGQAGMKQLLRLPFGAVKLERRFVHRLGTDPGAREIVRAAVSLAHGLELDLIAEGVETEGQATALWALGCDAVQGYLVARPMPPAELAAWMGARAGALA